MKKILVLLIVWLSVSVMTHADPISNNQQPVVSIPNSGDDEKIGLGSGDDLDTLNEMSDADISNDNPEADDVSAKI